MHKLRKQLCPDWAPHLRTWLTWPHEGSDWAGAVTAIEMEYTTLVQAITHFEPVTLICQHSALEARLGEQFSQTRHPVSTVLCETNDTWCRDYLPMTLVDKGATQWVDYTFDGWGGKFEANKDNRAGRTLWHGQPWLDLPLATEGGAFVCDEAGRLILSEQSLCPPLRPQNPDKATCAELLQSALGVTAICWLTDPKLPGDDTDGHADQLARFLPDSRLVYIQTEDETHPSFAAIQNNVQSLQAFAAPYPELMLHALPLPCVKDDNGQQLAASYANFIFVNGGLLLPAFGCPEDEVARKLFQALCPDRDIMMVPSRALVTQGGSLHCATAHEYEVLHES